MKVKTTLHTIDIDEVLRQKLGHRAQRIPRFVVAWLKRIVHQDEINTFLQGEGDVVGVQWLKDALDFLDVRVEVYGRENLPDPTTANQYIFVSNHPLGGADGVALGAVLGEHFQGKIRYLVNDLLLFLDGLAPLCVGINKTGRQQRSLATSVDAVFQSENAVILFPAGLCSRKRKGMIRDIPWRKTFVTKAVEFNRHVVPIYFDGKNSNRFYRIAQLCEKLHLKVNIAMLFLADEMFRNSHKTFKVHIGKPIPVNTFDATKTPQQWAQYVREVVYSMENN